MSLKPWFDTLWSPQPLKRQIVEMTKVIRSGINGNLESGRRGGSQNFLTGVEPIRADFALLAMKNEECCTESVRQHSQRRDLTIRDGALIVDSKLVKH